MAIRNPARLPGIELRNTGAALMDERFEVAREQRGAATLAAQA